MEGFKVVIVGGGSSHTPGIIQSLIANLDRFPLKKLVLYDIDPDRLELVDTPPLQRTVPSDLLAIDSFLHFCYNITHEC